MRILQVIPNLNIAGAEVMCSTLAIQLAKSGHDVALVSLFDCETVLTERVTDNKIEVYYLHKKNGLDFSIFRKLERVVECFRPDVIHSHLGALKYVLKIGKKYSIPIVHTVHNVATKESTSIERFVYKPYFRKKKVYPIGLSPTISDSIKDAYDLEYTPTFVYNGIDLERCIRKTSYSINGPIKIINVARFFEQKNHEALIKAVALLLEKNYSLELHLYGDGPTQKKIEKMTEDLNIQKSVFFHGVAKDVFNYLNEADIFVLPSFYEGIPLSLIEAMATGLPIVATSVGGIPNMLEDGKTGLLCNPDFIKISDKLEELISNQGLREIIGNNAVASALDNFSSTSMCNEYLKVYKNVWKTKE